MIKFLLLTGCRRAEAIGMQWSEVDLAEQVWEIPAERAKSKRAHRVPLAPLTLTIMGEPSGEYVFANGAGKPFRPGSATKVLQLRREEFGLDDVTVHDLRRSCATGLVRLGVTRFTIGRVLGHAEPGVTQIYDRYQYDREKRLALESWAAHLQRLVSGEPQPSNVRRLEVGR